MYDSREKAVLDIESNLIDAREEGIGIGLKQGIEKGIEKGIERGKSLGELIGKVRLLQELLGEDVARKEELENQSPELLTRAIETLQEKLTKRLS